MNMKNFKRIMDHIRANPTQWNQEHWHCGTTHCVAGFAHIFKVMDESGSNFAEASKKTRGWAEFEAVAFLELDSAALTIRDDYAFIFSCHTTFEELEAVERGERDPIHGEEIKHEIP